MRQTLWLYVEVLSSLCNINVFWIWILCPLLRMIKKTLFFKVFFMLYSTIVIFPTIMKKKQIWNYTTKISRTFSKILICLDGDIYIGMGDFPYDPKSIFVNSTIIDLYSENYTTVSLFQLVFLKCGNLVYFFTLKRKVKNLRFQKHNFCVIILDSNRTPNINKFYMLQNQLQHIIF